MPRYTLPPLEPLVKIVAQLERAGIVCALGGSGLLASLGLTERVRDWDLTTDVGIDLVASALRGHEGQRVPPGGIHADHKLVLAGPKVEVISRFALRSGSKVVRLPTLVTSRWRGVPVGSPEVWAAGYWLMRRRAKAEKLLALIEARGAIRPPSRGSWISRCRRRSRAGSLLTSSNA